MVIAVPLLRSVVVNSSGNKVGAMFGSAERVPCSLGMPGMLNGNECSEGWAEFFSWAA